jgi:hypothetical protein
LLAYLKAVNDAKEAKSNHWLDEKVCAQSQGKGFGLGGACLFVTVSVKI